MITDLVVLGRDPMFGGGSSALTGAFLEAARGLGYSPELVYDSHPGLRGPRFSWRRVEALRQLAWARHELPEAKKLWVASTHALEGSPAQRSGRTYDLWIATTVDAEFEARAEGLSRPRRAAAALSLAPLRALEQRVLRGARCVYGTSAATRTEIARVANRSDVGMLPIPVDVERFHPGNGSPAGRRVLFVGRANDPRKNLGLLIDAARLAPELEIELVGAPPAAALPANMRARGFVDDLPGALREASVLVIPSRQEGFGIVAAEALATAVPVVTTPCGGPEELVRESGGGWVLHRHSAEELAATLRDKLADSAALAEAGRSGRDYVEREHSPARFRELLADAFA
jgi:glycosyltransferase involved in cell wall biosynthesis